MKKIILLTCLILLAGCAKQPVIANLSVRLGEVPAGIYGGGSSVLIIGQDARKSQEVVVYMTDQPATSLANISPPLQLISEKLAEGLQGQGLLLDRSSPVQLKFSINELQVWVTRPKVLYRADAKTYITLTIENRGALFSKDFKREANQESATRPKLPDLEAMLNSQLSDIIHQILVDEEARKLIGKR
jgi:uncharacterized lipoprotein YajG